MACLGFLGIVIIVSSGAEVEQRALGNTAGLAMMLAVLGIAAICAGSRTAVSTKRSPRRPLLLEEVPVPAVMSLDLNRDMAPGDPATAKRTPRS